MAFVRGAWKIIVGIKDMLVLIFLLLFFGALFAALSIRGDAGIVSPGALWLTMNGTISEQPADPDPFASLMGEDVVRDTRARDIIRALDAAPGDDRVKAVVLELDGFMGAGRVTISDIGKRIAAVKKSGKPVYAFATAYTPEAYQLAVHASEIWADPLGGALLAGPGGTGLYFKELIDRLGINVRIYRVGTFKSAVEPFLLNGPSPEAQAADQALVDDLWEVQAAELRAARPKLNLAAAVGAPAAGLTANGGDIGQLALRTGVVDRLGDRAEFEARVAKIAGEANDGALIDRAFAAIDLDDFLAAHPADTSGDAIAVVTAAGDIMDGEHGPGTAGGDTIAALIDGVVDAGEARALVLRVDSPGGSVLASERIRRALVRAKAADLPIVVSMGNLAASGGYWIATPADRIFADPATITGSIGIFGIIPTFEGTLDKIGVGTGTVRTTPLSGEPDLAGGVGPELERIIQMEIETGYRRFVELVAEARGKTVGQVDAMAQGRVWAGGAARQLGLVDGFGDLDAALAEAARRAKLTKWHAVDVGPEPDPFIAFLSSFGAEKAQAGVGRDIIGLVRVRQMALPARIEAEAATLLGQSGAQARCLECSGLGGPTPKAAAPDGWWARVAALLIG